MAGGVLDLTNQADFPRLVDLTGNEIVPAADKDGAPVSITTKTLAQFATVEAFKPQYKDPVKIAFTANTDLATVINGAVFQGVTLATGDRVAFLAQTGGTANGIRVVAASGVPARSDDANTAEKIVAMDFLVLAGTEKRKHYRLKNTGTIVLNTTPLEFAVVDIPADQSALAEIAGGAPVTTGTGKKFAVLNAAGTAIELLSFDSLKAQLNEELMGPPTYVWPAHKAVKSTPVEIIPADAGLQRYDVYNNGAAPAWLSEAGAPASIGGFGTIKVPPEGIYSTDAVVAGALSAISSGETNLSVKFKTTTSYNVAARAAAQYYTDKVNALSTLSAAQVQVLQDFYAPLYSSGVLSVLGYLNIFVAPGLASLLNVCDPDSILPVTVGAVTRTNWRNLSFDGASGYLNSRRFMTEFARESDASLLVFPGSNASQGSSRVAIGEAEFTLTPARTSTTIAARTLGAAAITPAGFTAGSSLLSLSRPSADKVILRQGLSTKLEVADTATRLFSARNLLIGARNVGAVGGEPSPSAGSFFTGPMIAVGAGRALSDAHQTVLQNAIAKLVLDAGVFS